MGLALPSHRMEGAINCPIHFYLSAFVIRDCENRVMSVASHYNPRPYSEQAVDVVDRYSSIRKSRVSVFDCISMVSKSKTIHMHSDSIKMVRVFIESHTWPSEPSDIQTPA